MPTVDCPTCGRKLRLTEELLGAPVQCPRCGTTFTRPPPMPVPPAALPTDSWDQIVRDLVSDPEVPAPAALPADGWEPPVLDEEPPVQGLPPPPKPLRPVLLSSSTEAGELAASTVGYQFCPVCGNREAEEAPRCTLCGSELRVERSWRRAPELPPRRDYEPDRGQMLSTMGTLSVLFGLPGLCGAMYLPFAIASLLSCVMGGTVLVMSNHDLDQMERNIMDPQGRESTRSGQSQASIGLVLGIIGVLLGAVRLLAFFSDNW
jgi:hypothetical protein